MQALYREKTGEPVHTGLFAELKGQMKQSLHPDRLFEKDFLFLPMCLPGHWALAVVCRPHDLVQKLLGLPEITTESAGSGTHCDVASVEPCIIFVDSLGSKGTVWCTALAHLLVQAKQASLHGEPTHGTQLPTCDPVDVPRPDLTTPQQTNTYSCGDHVLVAMRRICEDVVRPSFQGANSSEIFTVERLETIITPAWYSGDEVDAERPSIHELLGSLQKEFLSSRPDQAESSSSQDGGEPEMKHLQEERDRSRRLRELVQGCLASFSVPTPSKSAVTVQQVFEPEFSFLL